jgi:hemerythrin-like metal-binding protein/PAS domain S-box-containing protein
MNFFQNLSIRAKLFSGIILIIFIFMILMIFQFSIVDIIDKNQLILNNTEKAVQATNQLIAINLGEMRSLLEIIQADDLSTVEALSKTNGVKVQEIKNLYNNLFLNIKSIFPDSSNLEKTKSINYLNDTQRDIFNELFPKFQSAVLVKKEQLRKGNQLTQKEISNNILESDSIVPEAEKEIIVVNADDVLGVSRSVQLIKQYRLYKQNHEQIYLQLVDLNKVLNDVFMASAQEIINKNGNIKILNSIFFILALIASIIIYLSISTTIAQPLDSLEKMVSRLSKGELPERSEIQSFDEIGKIASALNSLTDGLIKTSEFASEIGRSNFASKFEPLSNKDVLGNSLLEMRKSLQAASEEENKRKIEDQERNWTTEGLARFGEILRRHTENIGLLAKDIIQNLIKYLNANQGGIFILNDSDPENIYLELMSAYAFNREKFIEKRILLGEGLVGGAAVERYTIYMTDLPEEYIEIQSGLGGASPKSLLIVPLKLENAVLGVIEIASFNSLKKYEIELVERIGESIASTLSTAKINTRTAELLEQSRIQAQEMQEQEEEMRQNMEEMVAAQEESLRREEELRKEVAELDALRTSFVEKDKKQKSRLDELTKSNSAYTEENEMLFAQINRTFETTLDAVIIIDENRKIQFFNPSAEKLFDYNKSEILGRGFEILTLQEIADQLHESIALYLQTGRKGLIDEEREIEIVNKLGEKTPVVLVMLDVILRGSHMIAMFIKDMGEVRRLENEYNQVSDMLLSKEFDLNAKINILEDFIKTSGLQIPDDLEAHSDILRWNSSYSIELNIIDQQHKKWIEFINILYKSYKSNAKKKDISENISKLLDYTDYHFGFEEKYIEDFSCGNLENHKKEHAGFVTNIKKYKALHDEGNPEAAYKLIIYLNKWVINHIHTEDKRYVECFKLNGLV